MQHLLPDALRTFRYYERKLPLYLRNDECFIEHFYLWYELMMGKGDDSTGITTSEFCGVSPSSDLILYLLNIYDADFLTTLQSLPNYNGESDILDKLGNLFGLKRTFSLLYWENPWDTQQTEASVELTDAEFLYLIKAQIIRNYCNGSYEQAMQYYQDAGLEILVVYNIDYTATVDAYLNESENVTDNMLKLFKGGYLTIEHLGIRYTYNVSVVLRTLVWAREDGTGGSQVWADNDGNGGVFIV